MESGNHTVDYGVEDGNSRLQDVMTNFLGEKSENMAGMSGRSRNGDFKAKGKGIVIGSSIKKNLQVLMPTNKGPGNIIKGARELK